MKTLAFVGIDPGSTSGAIAAVGAEGNVLGCQALKAGVYEVLDWMHSLNSCHEIPLAVVENVHAMPKQGVASSFKFGRSLGQLDGLLAAIGWPVQYDTPVKWQTAMQCRSGGDKGITKLAAQRLFAGRIKITHNNADALLIAEYARRVSSSRLAKS